MKTFIILLIALFSFSVSKASDGQQTRNCKLISSEMVSSSGLQANIFQNASGRVTLIFVQPQESSISISVADNDQNILFKETLLTDSGRQHFQFKHAEKGSYSFTIKTNGECFVKTIEIQ